MKDMRTILNTFLDLPISHKFAERRLETGIAKPSMFQGISSSCRLDIPACFPIDLMHLAALNIPALMLSLFRGTIKCASVIQKNHGIGQFCRGMFGKLMGNWLQVQHHIFQVHLTRPHVIQLKSLIVGTRPGNFLSTSMVCALLCSKQCSLICIGGISANLQWQ